MRSLLALIDKRATGKSGLIDGKGNDQSKLKAMEEALENSKTKEIEEVTLKGTGRAIEKVLGLGLYFQGQDDCQIRLRTGTVGVVDDIVELEDTTSATAANGTAKVVVANNDSVDPQLQPPSDSVGNGGAEVLDEEDDGLPEAQIRKLGVIEVGISLRL